MIMKNDFSFMDEERKEETKDFVLNEEDVARMKMVK
jgi:hypothetical protein